jgi:hypothetical protein
VTFQYTTEVFTFQYTTIVKYSSKSDEAAQNVTRKLDSIVVALGKESDLLPWKASGTTWHHVLVVPETKVKREDLAMAMRVHDSRDRKWTSHVKKYVLKLKMEK